ncbi:MAG: HAMP domain-containing protein, partial [Planctomycetota bacterium]|nr:HAMP domain-containing protein [Planctomycetota bacterium]
MKSLTYKLVAVFLAMSLVPLIIGINAALSMRTAGIAIDADGRALKNLSDLLAAASDGIAESSRLQENASRVAAMVETSQQDTSSALRNMGEQMLPKTFAIAQLRFAIADVNAAERGLLLALNMSHLEADELRATRNSYEYTMRIALESLTGARNRYNALVSTPEETQAWALLLEAIIAWRTNHNAFMGEIATLDALMNNSVREGPVFASVSRRAYDTVFLTGRESRKECEQRISVLIGALARTARSNVQNAMASQARSSALLRDLGRETGGASLRAMGLREQIEAARAASAAAAGVASESLRATSRRFRLLVIVSALLVVGAMVAGVIIAWRISRPISDMARHLGLVAKGDLTGDVSRANLDRKDEIGQLARSLQDVVAANRMEIRMANAMAMGDYTCPVSIRSESDQLGGALRTMLANSTDTLMQVSRAVEQVGVGSQAVSEASRSLSQG